MIKSSLDQLAEYEDVEIIWRSFELRPKNMPAIPPDQEEAYRERVEAAWPQTQQTAKEAFGVEMIYHRWGINSRLAHEGAKFAEAQGHGEAYHEAMFQAHFVEDRDFGDLQLLADIAEDIGLDRTLFTTAIEDGEFASEVDRDIALARQYGLTGVPATIIDGKYLISGGQPLEALQDIVRQVQQKEEHEN